MRDVERDAAVSAIAARPEGEPHLTFQTLLADTLHEMAVHDEAVQAEPDAISTLFDDTVAALRAAGTAPLHRPFHHAYLTPLGTPALPSRPTRLDVLY